MQDHCYRNSADGRRPACQHKSGRQIATLANGQLQEAVRQYRKQEAQQDRGDPMSRPRCPGMQDGFK